MFYYSASFATREEAEAYAASVLASYPPEGYGTSLTVGENRDGTFLVSGSRLKSCD